MRIAIMGSGGIGGYVGARLAEAGAKVTFLARGAHLEAMKASGLRLKSPLGDVVLERVEAAERLAGAQAIDLVVFAVKLYDSETAAAGLASMIGPRTRVVTLQNGIDSADTLARHIPREQIFAGVTYISGYIEKPGVIVHPGGVTLTKTSGRGDPVVEAFHAASVQANGLDLQVVDNVEDAIWYKFVTICAFSGGTALLRAPIGPILANPPARLFLEQLRAEGIAVARAAGHPLPESYTAEVDAIWAKLSPETRSSMANDLDRRKPMELDWLSGRMDALGRELGIATPAHTAVYRALHLYRDGGESWRRA